MELTILKDAVPWVRSHPETFFPSGRVSAHVVLGYILSDALVFGRGECIIRQRADWYVIGSDIDWLDHPEHTADELFQRVVAAPEHGENSLRGEIVATAYSQSIWHVLDGLRTRVHGEEEPMDVWELTRGLRRAIVFKI